jgi:tetratricopeptide (TPR) repeat protein
VPEALAAARRAVALDPDFTIAQYQLSRIPSGEADQDAAEDALNRALRHPERLALEERVRGQSYLLRLQGKPREAIQVLRDAARDHPDDAAIWRHLGAALYHRGPLLGLSPQQSADAYQKQVDLDPTGLEPISALTELAVLRGEHAVALKLAQRRLSLEEHDQGGLMRFRLARTWAAGDTADHEQLMAQLKAQAKEMAPFETIVIIDALELQMDGSADAAALAALLPQTERTDLTLQLLPGFTPVAHTELMAGHIRGARRTMAEAIARHPAGYTAFYLPWIDTLELVHANPAQLEASRAAAASLDVTAEPDWAPEKQFLLGLLALRAHDLEAAESGVQALRSLPEIPRSSIVADLALSLQARILAARGDFKTALAVIDQEKVEIPERYLRFYGRARENFFRASLLVALGRAREALPLYEALAVIDLVDPVFYPAGQLYKARIHESLGETERAIFHYERFVAMWKECDPEEQPEVAIAQERLRHLRETR